MPFIRIKDCLVCHVPHEWLFEAATLKELRQIKKLTGMTVREFAEAGDDGDPDAIAALVYILHARDGIAIKFDDIDVDFKDFEQEPTEEEMQAIKKLEEEMQRRAEAAQGPKLT